MSTENVHDIDSFKPAATLWMGASCIPWLLLYSNHTFLFVNLQQNLVNLVDILISAVRGLLSVLLRRGASRNKRASNLAFRHTSGLWGAAAEDDLALKYISKRLDSSHKIREQIILEFKLETKKIPRLWHFEKTKIVLVLAAIDRRWASRRVAAPTPPLRLCRRHAVVETAASWRRRRVQVAASLRLNGGYIEWTASSVSKAESNLPISFR